VLKIGIKTRTSVDTFGSRADTKRTGDTHFDPIGKPIPKLWAIHVASAKYHTLVHTWFYLRCATVPIGPGRPYFRGFMIILRHTMLGRIPLDESSARRKYLYQTTNNTHKTEIFRRPAGFKSVLSASDRPQTYALGWAATGIGIRLIPGTKQDKILIYSAYFSPLLAWVCYLVKWCGLLRDLE